MTVQRVNTVQWHPPWVYRAWPALQNSNRRSKTPYGIPTHLLDFYHYPYSNAIHQETAKRFAAIDRTGNLGFGLLCYFSDRQQREPTYVYLVVAPAWIKSGVQPFVWEMIPTPEAKTPALVRIVATRECIIEGPVAWRANPQAASQLPPPPELEIHRLQNDALLPAPGTPINVSSILQSPFRWLPGRGYPDSSPPREGLDEESPATADEGGLGQPQVESSKSAIVYPQPSGLFIEHEQRHWAIQIECDPWKPAAFAYQLRSPIGTIRAPYPDHKLDYLLASEKNPRLKSITAADFYFIRILRTENVSVKCDLRESAPLEKFEPVYLSDRVVERAEIPPQGAELPVSGVLYNSAGFGNWTGNRKDKPILLGTYHDFLQEIQRSGTHIFILETGIGFVPVVGDLYDIANYVCAASTGETLLGEAVDETELAFMGIMAILPAAFQGAQGAAKVARVIRSVNAKGARLLLDPATMRTVRERLDPALLEAVQELDPQAARKLRETPDQ